VTLSLADKFRFFREATRGAEDVVAIRSDTDGFGPPWKPAFGELNDDLIRLHLTGEVEIGSYPLIPVYEGLPLIWWIGADFDGKREGSYWEQDVRRATRFLLDIEANLLVNLSRSAHGAHVRVLFREPVPAWMARRWMYSWLEEANVVKDDPFAFKTSYDRFIPPQDTLPIVIDSETGRRVEIGNLLGSPLNGRLARAYKGTLVLDPEEVAADNFEPDGKHWDHLVKSVEDRAWGLDELRKALSEAPGTPDMMPPTWRYGILDGRRLRVVNAEEGMLDFTLRFCEFFRYVRREGQLSYTMWLALATQLHHFGDDGHRAFHEISSLDSRYKYDQAEKLWRTTRDLPQKCTTIAAREWRCPHLDTVRCAGAKAPAYFPEHVYYEPTP
jgi:hypothetical protein